MKHFIAVSETRLKRGTLNLGSLSEECCRTVAPSGSEFVTLRYSPLENLVRSDKRTRKGSSLVRRLVLARDDPAKERIRRWLSAIDDDQLLSFGLTPLDIVILRSVPARQPNS